MNPNATTHDGTLPPSWALAPRRSLLQSAWDLAGAPLRMVLLPDSQSERLHLTSLRAERYAAVLPQLRGRVLDIGAGDNALIRLYLQRLRRSGKDDAGADDSVGVDVVDWGGDTLKIASSDSLPFEAESFDTVAFVACLNHIPERIGALKEAHRVLKPGGLLVATMIGRLIGDVGHAIWWYSEDKHRDVAEGEVMGIDKTEMLRLLEQAGFTQVSVKRFVYGMNYLYLATRT
ncbi:class I SAM-dependent methyltransferase [Bradyrhizobium sp. IC3069]|uniref:class I SAM-dependent methyltransferase n=2 Tax=Bradyrhizobium TaxID=374 RepID=UPI001CD77EF6|nr:MULTISPECIES: class I SAM-dependent methyltransferase [unclassified Bradyrhizobium]MCA1365103.1 class I SAM-dependent methyltransferase [Bradyrhizobium sp. IC4059]MCA1436191.1 class I SAM-dependent methyltransferase [Bradyrhizobium sp. BRP20]MCA1522768.1 class I SAM-dependent methyltransferase [Bradyrhizobium sp. IC3069]